MNALPPAKEPRRKPDAIPDRSSRIAADHGVQLSRSLRRQLVRGPNGPMLQHPLISQPYFPQHNALYNRQYHDKLAAARQARKAKDWGRFIWLHEPIFRVTAFKSIAHAMSHDQYWRKLAEVWIDSKGTFPRKDIWISLWTADRPQRELVMTPTEQEMLAVLPESTPGMVPIYRGCYQLEAVAGLSWTIDRALAIKYARGAIQPVLASAQVRKQDIKAYFDEQNEQEVVVMPADCQTLVVEKLKP
jgi:hypothetical protein